MKYFWDPLQRVQRLRRADAAREHDQGTDRLPPGQALTLKFPVLTYGSTPNVRPDDWTFEVWGLVEEPKTWTWDEFLAIGAKEQVCDIHCVTRWSKFDTLWKGIPFKAVYEQLKPKPGADYVMLHSYGGYTTNMRVDEMLDDSVMFAYEYEGKPLERDHGGPMRALVPRLYFWKSAKWVRGLEFMNTNRPGFWEMYGYHIHGDYRLEQRFS
ncbi:MAG: sulfite oxidase-like oxidoreductase [Anaerolineae bacterium]